MAGAKNPTSYYANLNWVAPGAQQTFDWEPLIDMVNKATIDAKSKLGQIKAKGSAMSIADMFEMQLMMNKLSQVSDMVSNMMAAVNAAISGMSRNLK